MSWWRCTSDSDSVPRRVTPSPNHPSASFEQRILTPFWLDHLMVVVLTVFFPIRAATFGYRRLVLAPAEHVADLRRALYFQAIALQWGLVALALAVWLIAGRSAMALGLAPRDPRNLLWGLLGALVIAAAFWFVRTRVRRDPEA